MKENSGSDDETLSSKNLERVVYCLQAKSKRHEDTENKTLLISFYNNSSSTIQKKFPKKWKKKTKPQLKTAITSQKEPFLTHFGCVFFGSIASSTTFS